MATGKAEGRFGAVTFTVLGPNKEVSIPATMVSTGVAGANTDLSKVFNCYRVESTSNIASMFNNSLDDLELGKTD